MVGTDMGFSMMRMMGFATSANSKVQTISSSHVLNIRGEILPVKCGAENSAEEFALHSL